MIELHILLVFMIIGAIIAVEVKSLLSSIVAVGAVGLGLSVAFLILKAPDLAIVQLVVEILALLILLRATFGDRIQQDGKKKGIAAILVSIVFVLIFLTCSYYCLKNLPEFGYPLMKVSQTYINEGLQQTGAANIVAAIILNFRGYDTLGEVTVLFSAVVGALAVLRAVGRKRE